MDLGTTMVRGVVGPLFMGHGAQKLWGSFGGHGPEGTGGFFESLGLRPGVRHAKAAGWAEFGGGLLVTLGALTPLGSTLLTSTMVTAIRKVHGSKGPWATEGGWEYNATIIAIAGLLADIGPGAPSVDDVLFPDMHGKGWAIAALLAGVAGSYVATSPALSEAPADAPAADVKLHGDPAAADADESRFVRDQEHIGQSG